jgi:SAM-dependent methyltransferase
MTAEDRDRWEARWRARRATPGAPEPFLLEHLAALQPGRVLDVAAGDGRNALALARAGFEVTAVDIASTGLGQLDAAAAAGGRGIAVRLADLDEPAALEGLQPFDNLVVIRYRPSLPQWQRLLGLLRPGGLVLLCSFGAAQADRKAFARRFCLVRDEVAAELGEGMECLVWRSFDQGGDALEGSPWRRKPPDG